MANYGTPKFSRKDFYFIADLAVELELTADQVETLAQALKATNGMFDYDRFVTAATK